MKAYRHRLIFWPLFCGSVVFWFSGYRDDLRYWPVIINAAVTVAFVLAAIYASDRDRPRSGTVRVVVILICVLAAADLLVTQFVPGCDLAIFFFLLVFAAPMVRATIRNCAGRRSAACRVKKA
jgi:hypothetical protein